MAFEQLRAVSEEFAEAVEKIRRSTVRVAARTRVAGTGIIWSADGVILTADHVVEREENIIVQTDGDSHEAELAGRDPATDIAVLRIKGGPFVAAEIAGPQSVRPGNIVFAVGRPWGEEAVVSAGIVSAIGRIGWERGWGEQFREGLIHADVSLYPGFSGGPLGDAGGRIVGMNTSAIGRGMSLAVPTETATRVIAELLKEGRIRRGFLGVGIQKVPLAGAIRQQLGLTQETGLIVLTVEPGTAAEAAGILPGDILVGTNGTPLARVRELHRWLGTARAGQQAQLRVIRGGELKQISVTLGER